MTQELELELPYMIEQRRGASRRLSRRGATIDLATIQVYANLR